MFTFCHKILPNCFRKDKVIITQQTEQRPYTHSLMKSPLYQYKTGTQERVGSFTIATKFT